MTTDCAACESVEIGPRFREMIEERIARLDADAARDEARIEYLRDPDHIRRQSRLVAVEREV